MKFGLFGTAVPSISIKNVGSRNFEILGFLHLEFEILGISLEIPRISNSGCEKPSTSKFLIGNTQYFD